MKKSFLSIVLTLCMVLAMLPAAAFASGSTAEFAGGTGVESDPYLISTTTHLNNVRNYLGAHFKMVNDIEFADADFAEGGAFYNIGKGWAPIGNGATPFAGTFDGNNFAVKNLYINISSDGNVRAGLFGYSTGKIKNLGMVDGDIAAKASQDAYAGNIVAFAFGSISNCYSTGDVYSDGINSFAGGIVGYSAGAAISNCSNSGGIGIGAAGGSVGGIVGHAYIDSSITGCNNAGSISGTGAIGGIVGHIYDGSVTDCYNTGSISAGGYAGGIVGYGLEATIRDCYNTDRVSADGTAGGIVGYSDSYGEVSNCYNTGSISADGYAGGIVCRSDGYITITNCYNNGNVDAVGGVAYANGIGNGTTITNCYNIGSVSAENIVGVSGGGLAPAYASGIGNGTTIIGCYNAGSVSAVAVVLNGVACAGGIMDTGGGDDTIYNCYNVGSVNAEAYNYSDAGGIVGSAYDTVTIANCYNVGSVNAEGFHNSRAGGIAGWAYKTTNQFCCYYLDNIAQGIGYGIDAGTKCTDAKLKRQSTFAGFDFTDVWTMEGNTAYPYPELLENEHIMPPPAFADIPEDSWQYPFAKYAVENGLMAGKGTDADGNIKFDPNSPIKREEFVQVLYNAEGKPAVTIPNTFPDVAEGGWYKNAVLWAKQNDIASGKGNGNFGVGENISRQDLAMMLYKYAKLNGYSLAATEGLINQFADGDMVASYATGAMDWAVSNGIMSGKGAAGADLSTFRLDPTGIATRAECAAMLKNFRTAFEY